MTASRKKDMLILQMGDGQMSVLFTFFYTHTDQVVVDVVDWPILKLSLEFKVGGILLREAGGQFSEGMYSFAK